MLAQNIIFGLLAAAMVIGAALLMTRRSGTTPEPEPHALFVEELIDPSTPDLLPEPHDMPLDALLNDNGVVWPLS